MDLAPDRSSPHGNGPTVPQDLGDPWHWVEATVTAGSAGPPARAEILVDFSTRARLLWGGANSTGTPCLDPALVVDVSPSLPEQSGPWTLEGQDTGGRVLFTLPFVRAKHSSTNRPIVDLA